MKKGVPRDALSHAKAAKAAPGRSALLSLRRLRVAQTDVQFA